MFGAPRATKMPRHAHFRGGLFTFQRLASNVNADSIVVDSFGPIPVPPHIFLIGQLAVRIAQGSQCPWTVVTMSLRLHRTVKLLDGTDCQLRGSGESTRSHQQRRNQSSD